jgi:hypothetical protein
MIPFAHIGVAVGYKLSHDGVGERDLKWSDGMEGGTTWCKGLNVGSSGRSGKLRLGLLSILCRFPKGSSIIDSAASIYTLSEKIYIPIRLTIAGKALVVGEDTSCVMTD